MGKVIVFEGPDKVGKETQSKRLAVALNDMGVRAVRVEPSKEANPRLKKLIYSMLETGAAKRYPNTFQFVQFLNKIYFQTFKLPKLVRDNEVVILDRWALSGYAYGRAEGISDWLNKWMFNRVKKVDQTLVLYGASYRRDGQADDSYERDTELQKRVKEIYYYAGLHFPNHSIVFNDVPVEKVHERILDKLEEKGLIPSSRCPVCKAKFDEPCEEAYHR